MLTLLSCGQGQNGLSVSALIEAFKARVAADSGIFEAESCLLLTLDTLDGKYLLGGPLYSAGRFQSQDGNSIVFEDGTNYIF